MVGEYRPMALSEQDLGNRITQPEGEYKAALGGLDHGLTAEAAP